jgi:hypothetical protein
MSNVDKFFKDKLGNHSIPPAPQSWEKVESRLSKKNNLSLVLRVAAGIALAGMLVMLILSQTDKRVPAPLVKTDIKTVPPVKSSAGTEQPKEVDKVLPPQHDRTQVAKQSSKKIETPEATPTPEPVVMDVPVQDLIAEVEQPQEAKPKRMILVYTLPTVAKKTEADAVAVATADEEKRSGLQKVMDAALEVKSGDNPLGDLREAKDELFALEFRKDKNKGKNH